MQLRVFTIPLRAGHEHQDDMNRFLRSHRVLSVDKRFTDAPGQACWTFCVEYLDRGTGENGNGKGAPKIDYKERLSPKDFAVYDKLRQLRKRLAEEEKVPPFALFTNEQLAQMVERKVTTIKAMEEIDGIGPARISKYGETFVKVLQEELSACAVSGT
jgi:superfamily II DNA helicase RecQ